MNDMNDVNIVIIYESEKYNINIDKDDDLDLIKFQIYSLTDIIPNEQQLYTGKGILINNNFNIHSFNSNDTIIVRQIKPQKLNNHMNNNNNNNNNNNVLPQWDQCCTRIFFGADVKIRQPIMNVNGMNLCLGCSTTCHLPKQISGPTAVYQSCQCPIATCLFASRVNNSYEILKNPQQLALVIDSKCNQILDHKAQKVANRIMSAVDAFQRNYTNDRRQKALDVLPIKLLEERTHKAMEEKEKEKKVVLDYKDELLLQLLKWYKFEFFKWVNEPECNNDSCDNKKTRAVGHTAPNNEERKWFTGVTELYHCDKCGQQTRFPRYNDPVKLLETRKGRCGEFANLFTLFCLALGMEARVANDFTDHVWTEVWSESKQRWCHSDCCENAYDAPLMYEEGWGKKLNYIIAVSNEEIIDVTRRYTNKYTEVLTRRDLCREEWLEKFLNQMDQQLRSKLSSSHRQHIINERRKLELEELMKKTPREELKPEEEKGRQTGSYEWKEQRGELGKK